MQLEKALSYVQPITDDFLPEQEAREDYTLREIIIKLLIKHFVCLDKQVDKIQAFLIVVNIVTKIGEK